MHLSTVDQTKAIKAIKIKLTDIDKMKMDEQKRAARSGYDIDILPPDLITYSKDAAALLADLQSRNERMFLLTFTIVNTAQTRQRLENDIHTIAGICQKYNCALKRLDFQQERAFMSSLILGHNEIEIQRGMTTSSTAIFVPIDLLGVKCTNPNKPSSHAICGTDGRTLQKPMENMLSPQEHSLFSYGVFKCSEKYFSKVFEKCSDLPLVFLLIVKGYSPATFQDGYTQLIQKGKEGRRITILKDILTQNLYSERSRYHENHCIQCG